MIAAPIGNACLSHSEEGVVHVDLRMDACPVVLWAEGIHINGRKNRSVLVPMCAGERMAGTHNGSHRHVV
jgi:hypothetical protein